MSFITPTDILVYISITFLVAVFVSQCNSLIQHFFKLKIFAVEKGLCYAGDIRKINLKTSLIRVLYWIFLETIPSAEGRGERSIN